MVTRAKPVNMNEPCWALPKPRRARLYSGTGISLSPCPSPCVGNIFRAAPPAINAWRASCTPPNGSGRWPYCAPVRRVPTHPPLGYSNRCASICRNSSAAPARSRNNFRPSVGCSIHRPQPETKLFPPAARANLCPPPRTLRLKLIVKSRDAFTPDSSDQRRALGSHRPAI